MKKGMTLIEVMLYIAISSIFLIIVLNFFTQVLIFKDRIEASRGAVNDAQYIVQKVDAELRNATTVLSVSNNEICLGDSTMGWFGASKIYKNGDYINIARGWGFWGCSYVTYDDSMTSNYIKVGALTFEDITPSGNDSKTIRYEIKFNAPDRLKGAELPGGDDAFTFGSTVVVRSYD